MRYDVLVKVKKLLDIDSSDMSSDEVISLLADKNESFIRGYCGIDKSEVLSDELLNAVEDLTVCAFNKIGSEGFKNETIGPIRIDYSEMPYSCKTVLDRYRRVSF